MRFALFLCFAVLLEIYAPTAGNSGQSTAAVNSLTIEDVVALVKKGFSEEVIITQIRKRGKAFDLNPDEMAELRKQGVSDNVVRYLLDPSLPYTPPPPPAPTTAAPGTPAKLSGPAKIYAPDKLAGLVPPDPGIYYFGASNEPVKLAIKVLLGSRQGAGMTKVLRKKARTLAYLPGPTAKLRIRIASPTLYARLPEGKNIEDQVLITLDRTADGREIDLGPGDKLELSPTAIRQFDTTEVGPGLFRITPAPLKDGEYLLYQIGSAEKDKGTEGKGAEFAIATGAPR